MLCRSQQANVADTDQPPPARLWNVSSGINVTDLIRQLEYSLPKRICNSRLKLSIQLLFNKKKMLRYATTCRSCSGFTVVAQPGSGMLPQASTSKYSRTKYICSCVTVRPFASTAYHGEIAPVDRSDHDM